MMRLLLHMFVVFIFYASDALALESSVRNRIQAELNCTDVVMPEGNGVVDGPIEVTGYSSGKLSEKKDSTVFWCQRGKDDYLLVFEKNGALFHEKCLPYLEWYNRPLGLHLVTERMQLSDFVYLHDQLNENQHDLSNIETQGMVVQDRDSADSIEANFYCYNGKWMVAQRD